MHRVQIESTIDSCGSISTTNCKEPKEVLDNVSL